MLGLGIELIYNEFSSMLHHSTEHARMNSAASSTVETPPIHLGWDDGAVVISSADESRLGRMLFDALDACGSDPVQAHGIDDFKTGFLPLVRQWCEAHRGLLRSCHLSLASRPMTLLVVSQSTKYDFSLSDPAADLEMELFKMNWPVEVLHVPNGSPESLRSLFDPAQSVSMYGHAC
jgi:hypothetical protein